MVNNATLTINPKNKTLPATPDEAETPYDQETELDRDTLLAIELFKNPKDVQQAGLNAGFSPVYVKSGNYYNKLKSPTFQQKLKEYAISYDYRHLPLIYGLEQKALEAAFNQATTNEDSAIGNVSKLKHILKQKKQITGILRDDIQPPKTTTINIQELRLIHANLLPDTGVKPQDIVDGEVVDSGK